jgi:Ca-activated chloride channel family protein
MILVFVLNACGPINALLPKGGIEVSILYGSEKQAWLEPLVKEFNEASNRTPDGQEIIIKATPMGSIESVRGIIDGTFQPTVWSPASSIYIPVANAEWKKTHADQLVTGTPNDLVLSPVVIAMWRPMAQALGWPDKRLGWEDIANLASSPDGWQAYGHPEWGPFKFGHTHPAYSNSGLVSIIAESYAGAGKQRGLNEADLKNPELANFISAVESGVIHYGTSTGFFATRMFERGPSYLSAAVIYENLIVEQEARRLDGTSSQIPVVAIYPKEGTFWSNHPYAVLNAPWVTDEQKLAAVTFESFLLDRSAQLKALEYGFRPADPSISLSSPIDYQHGVDPSEPKTTLEIPTAPVIEGIQELWRQNKKPVDLTVVMDVSGSMAGDKITTARSSLMEFVNKLEDRDRIKIIIFSNEITVLTDLTEIGPKRSNVLDSISGIFENGDTRLYDASLQAYSDHQLDANPRHIRSIVILTDGQDTASTSTLEDLMVLIRKNQGEGGNSIKLFTIAFGDDADRDILKMIADPTGGKEYDSSPENIQKIYDDIATFF